MRCFMTVVVAAFCSPGLSADVTIRQTMTMEGQMAAMAAGKLPEMVTRIKGMKSRTDIDIDGKTISSITDIDAKQVTILNSAAKTAMVMTPGAPATASNTSPRAAGIDVTIKATGQSKAIDGRPCDEHTMAMMLDMTTLAGSGGIPPEAAAAMKDVRMMANGAVWVTKTGPGVDEYVAFHKAAIESNLLSALSSLIPQGGMDKLLSAVSSAPGVPCLTEFTMTFEGTGPMVDVMKQMGPMKMMQKTVTISVDPVPEATFVVPADYKVEKK